MAGSILRHVQARPGTLVSTERATRVRHKVVGLAVLFAMVTYLDRACIATLAPDIMKTLALTRSQMSWVYSAFALSYALFEIPTAWWADRVGTRRVLTRIVLWWSSFTMATGAAFNFVSLLATRFLFGMGEAGAWPSAARTFARWIPRAERGRVQGVFFSGAHLAGGLPTDPARSSLRLLEEADLRDLHVVGPGRELGDPHQVVAKAVAGRVEIVATL